MSYAEKVLSESFKRELAAMAHPYTVRFDRYNYDGDAGVAIEASNKWRHAVTTNNDAREAKGLKSLSVAEAQDALRNGMKEMIELIPDWTGLIDYVKTHREWAVEIADRLRKNGHPKFSPDKDDPGAIIVSATMRCPVTDGALVNDDRYLTAFVRKVATKEEYEALPAEFSAWVDELKAHGPIPA